MRLFQIILLFFLSSSLFSQISKNPFEIQSRLDSVYNKSSETTESSTNNVFDIERRNIEAQSQSSTSNSLESVPNSDLVPQVGEDDPNTSEEDASIDDLSTNNPFEVSHIPVRKSKLKNEANAFKPKISKDKKSSTSNIFLFWLLLFTFLLISVVINTKKNVIKNVSKAITNENVLKLNFREENQGLSAQYILLYICFLVNGAIFLYLTVTHFSKSNGTGLFKWCLLGIIAVYSIKHISLRILSTTFPFKKDINLYGFTIQVFNIFLGLVLIPINLIVAFNGPGIAVPFLYFGIGLVGLALLIRYFRGLFIASPYMQSNFFHFLLYLCGFEILPALLLIKSVGILNFS